MIKKSFAELPKSLQRGINLCPEGFEIEINRDELMYLADKAIWTVPFSIIIEETNSFIPKKTFWYCLVDDSYPLGDIDVYPSRENGVEATFPHQNLNLIGNPAYPWRAGKLCLDGPFSKKIGSSSSDPYGNSEDRLRWHLFRSLKWVKGAVNGSLISEGDPFELPQYPSYVKGNLNSVLVYESNKENLSNWKVDDLFGPLEIFNISGLKGICNLQFYKESDRSVIQGFSGRSVPLPAGAQSKGLWILWPKPFVIEPWKAPTTWGEVRKFATECRIDLDSILRKYAKEARGKGSTVLAFGYRIPLYLGKDAEEIHWKAIQLPSFKKVSLNGFRNNEVGWWANDKKNNFNLNNLIQYLDTRNFDQKRLQARGVLPDFLRSKKIVMIGVGALGSMILDSIVRGGIKDLLIIDPEELEAGNVCRHVLTMNEIKKPKVEGVKNLLEQINPYVQVKTLCDHIPTDKLKLKGLFEEWDIVIDCTGSNEVLETLSKVEWRIPKYFFSFSLTWGATALFSYASYSTRISSNKFTEQIGPFLTEYPVSDGVIEGAGCWSPLFPGRHDSIMYASCLCVKELTGMMNLKLDSDYFHKRDIPL